MSLSTFTVYIHILSTHLPIAICPYQLVSVYINAALGDSIAGSLLRLSPGTPWGMPGGRRSGLAWQARRLWGLYIAGMLPRLLLGGRGGDAGGEAGGTSRWFGVAGAALADSKAGALPQLSPGTPLDAAVVWRGRGGARGLYCRLPRLSLGGRRGGLAWQARHLGALYSGALPRLSLGRCSGLACQPIHGDSIAGALPRLSGRWGTLVWSGRRALKNSITNALLRLSLGGRRGGLAWQARHLGTLL